MIQVRGVHKSFGKLEVLKGIDLDVKKGEVVSVIGGSGSGKSTLLYCINAIEPINSGEIIVDDIDVHNKNTDQNRLREKLGMVFQQWNSFPHLTVLENVVLAVYRHERPGMWEAALRLPSFFAKEKAAREEAFKYLRLLSLEDWAFTPASRLPFGTQRYLEIVRALATRPRLLLLDEAASGLDAAEKATLAELIRNLKKQGLTILMVEHDMNLTMDLADEVIVLDQGEKIAQGTPREIQRDEKVIAFYLGGEDARH
jgi:ABC-type branched-subunit amino acid transport system ATPase component